LEEAVSAFEAIHSDYERHSRAAREIAEAYFDSKRVAREILDCALSRPSVDGHTQDRESGLGEGKPANLVPG